MKTMALIEALLIHAKYDPDIDWEIDYDRQLSPDVVPKLSEADDARLDELGFHRNGLPTCLRQHRKPVTSEPLTEERMLQLAQEAARHPFKPYAMHHVGSDSLTVKLTGDADYTKPFSEGIDAHRSLNNDGFTGFTLHGLSRILNPPRE